MLRAAGSSPLGERQNLCVGPFIPDLKLLERNLDESLAQPKPLPLATTAAATRPRLPPRDTQLYSEDKLTPRLLEALEALDQGAERLAALSPRAASLSPPPQTKEASEEEPEWLREASTSLSQPENQLASIVAVSALGLELRQCEAASHHHRSCAEAQVRAMAEVNAQLAITKEAAETTAAAARVIVDDHERDVQMLLSELCRLDPRAAEAVEGRLSAPLVALAARKRQAATRAPKPAAARDASPILERISRTASEVGVTIGRSLSFKGRSQRSASPFGATRMW
uniref:Uncharacterized protein n=1 Tax=Haptolina brevifila TaxID=156173 RepID=A0A7S2FF07_9EUKA|mmetsp:Transcript_11299/g.22851  ORF Transcript_11299/g.22851 Transcript_11299/m.22851 type:complete len:284 (+) Transcript_11299:54-905(+)|eukprot:CAMPEP_0174703960 /NCGR_PEP_ID=MMETSP1094-20130205/7726_1 /TAXON_ID=156173 /ORGANISM="Chrysochromulina brevifilum, Strain UTEX LB 985" /LENGTH=283 /DNA_ID=CAMNT_0015901957 /DNA_START=53 /DNA_END=904 /DNA_ORIENTATION=-